MAPPHPLQDVLGHIERFDSRTIAKAPSCVGLYAWYGRLDAGLKDWELELVNGIDAGVYRFTKLLQQHTSRYQAPPLKTKAKGSFAITYEGSLEERSLNFLQTILNREERFSFEFDENDSNETTRNKTKAKHLHDTVDRHKTRGWLVDVLRITTPILSSPVYIGVSENLNNRLGTHLKELRDLSEATKHNPTNRESLLNAPKSSFASRAIGMGFSTESLEVWTLNLETALGVSNDPASLRTMAEAAEWLLNRWHRPTLGRR